MDSQLLMSFKCVLYLSKGQNDASLLVSIWLDYFFSHDPSLFFCSLYSCREFGDQGILLHRHQERDGSRRGANVRLRAEEVSGEWEVSGLIRKCFCAFHLPPLLCCIIIRPDSQVSTGVHYISWYFLAYQHNSFSRDWHGFLLASPEAGLCNSFKRPSCFPLTNHCTDMWSVLDVLRGAKAYRPAPRNPGRERWRRYAGPFGDPFPEAQ